MAGQAGVSNKLASEGNDEDIWSQILPPYVELQDLEKGCIKYFYFQSYLHECAIYLKRKGSLMVEKKHFNRIILRGTSHTFPLA